MLFIFVNNEIQSHASNRHEFVCINKFAESHFPRNVYVPHEHNFRMGNHEEKEKLYCPHSSERLSID